MGGMTVTYAPGSPSWVDLGTPDTAAAAAFYSAIFGWTHQDMGEETGHYGIFYKDGKQVGGVGPLMNPSQPTAWSTYFAVANADDTAAKVTNAGGQVMLAPMDVMDLGRMGVFTDPAGFPFSIWQAAKHKGSEIIREPGSVTWNELVTTDAEGAEAFYRDALDLDPREVSMGPGMTYTLMQVDGHPVAGMMAFAPEMGDVPTGWTIYFEVTDADAAYGKAVEFGATTHTPPTDVPPGRFAIVDDPQGATFGIMQSNPDFQI